MRIAVLTWGSRGDVEPLIALGGGLREAGHSVVLATGEAYEDMVRAWELPFACLEGGPGWSDAEGDGQPRGRLSTLREQFATGDGNLLRSSLAACQRVDAIIWTPLVFTGYHVAERLAVPAAAAILQPLTPTRAFPCPSSPDLPLGGLYNRATYSVIDRGVVAATRPVVNRWRGTLGMAPMPRLRSHGLIPPRAYPVICGFSPLVVPVPRDWPDNVRVTGYWFLDEPPGWEPPAALSSFLAAGAPPVGIALGTMTPDAAEEVIPATLAALADLGRRALLVGDMEGHQVPPDVFAISDAPYGWLFPKLAAVVHHGGAGTTAATLRAGVPAVIVPFDVDQPFWARQVARLGTASEPLPPARATVQRLTRALDAALNEVSLRERAHAIGSRIRSEDGTGAAVAAVERLVRRR
jgi:UDP:flavonoid glycosyltransferase YjiC (YdhE family)